jgi:GNAT superfamily N-acetyltransferase
MGLAVRPFDQQDLEQVVQLFESMHAESWYKDLDFDPVKIRDLLLRVSLSRFGMFGQLLCHDDTPVGFLFGALEQHYFGNDWFAADFGLYVAPAYRGTLMFRRLIRNFEAWAYDVGASEILMGVSSGISDRRVVRLYEHMGYAKGAYALHKKCIARN